MSGSVKTMSPAEVQAAVAGGAVTLVDVRQANEWAGARIDGAINRPLSTLQAQAASLPTDKPVVFHCVSGARSGRAIELCRSLGLPHDTHMAGGITAWMGQNLPVVRAPNARVMSNPMNVQRAVMGLAGAMVLLSVLLTVLVHPYFVWFTALIGLNLIQSGVTGFCPAARLFRAFA